MAYPPDVRRGGPGRLPHPGYGPGPAQRNGYLPNDHERNARRRHERDYDGQYGPRSPHYPQGQRYQEQHPPEDAYSAYEQNPWQGSSSSQYDYANDENGAGWDDRQQWPQEQSYQHTQQQRRPPEARHRTRIDPQGRDAYGGPNPRVPPKAGFPPRGQGYGSSGYSQPQDHNGMASSSPGPDREPAQAYYGEAPSNGKDYAEPYNNPHSIHQRPQGNYPRDYTQDYTQEQAYSPRGPVSPATGDQYASYENTNDHQMRQMNHGVGEHPAHPDARNTGSSGLPQDPRSRFDVPNPERPRRSPNHLQNDITANSSSLTRTELARPPRSPMEAVSPELRSWDNPFPTFPANPKKTGQTDTQNLEKPPHPKSTNDPADSNRIHDERPSTAQSKASKSSHVSNDSVFARYSDEKTGFKDAENTSASTSRANDPRPQPPISVSDTSTYPIRERSAPETRAGLGPERHLQSPPLLARHSEDNRAIPNVHQELRSPENYERSQTMPTGILDRAEGSGLMVADDMTRQEPGGFAGYYGPEDRGFLPKGPTNGVQPKTTELRGDKNVPRMEARVITPQPHIAQESAAVIYDTYTETPQIPYQAYQAPSAANATRRKDQEIPDFAAVEDASVSHRRGLTLETHLQSRSHEYREEPLPHTKQPFPHDYNPTYGAQQGHFIDPVSRSQSQPTFNTPRSPNTQRKEGFDFGVPSNGERRPATAAAYNRQDHYSARSPHAQRSTEGWRGQGPYSASGHGTGPFARGPPDPRFRDERRGPGPPQGMGPGLYRGDPRQGQFDKYRQPAAQADRPSPGRMPPSAGQFGPLDQRKALPQSQKPLPNPDALPSHPPPVRPGLINSAAPNPLARPPPIRQYNSEPREPDQSTTNSQPAVGSTKALPVTYQELERLRQAATRNPQDNAVQLQLAKKLAEASTVLIDDRADLATKKKNREKFHSDALRILRKLSSVNYAEGDFFYADCYSRGILGLQSDIKEAFTLYQRAAKANHAQAAYRVAVCCEIGQEEGGGTKRDPVKAMQWYKRAAMLGDVAAMYKMGVVQLKGLLGQPRDPKDALLWLKKAAERADHENPHALHELGLLHENAVSIEGIRRDENRAREYFLQAANLGYKFSEYRLGCAYEYGQLGCPVDPRQSIAWYSKAAVQEEHQSELALSGWYLTGTEGVLQQSDTEAYLWARKAAQAGLAKAEYAMGYFTEVGIGAPANMEDAKRWYWRAASQNFPKARERLEDLRKGGGQKQKTRVSRSNMKKQSDGECVVM